MQYSIDKTYFLIRVPVLNQQLVFHRCKFKEDIYQLKAIYCPNCQMFQPRYVLKDIDFIFNAICQDTPQSAMTGQ